ncbi:MFS transporter [Phycicoccus endophyticus]|uniref:MFS transporter n=1 Tax=Phycicoccus endophyticus TaxID=1690220 RepID=A0A7G9QZN3_9MICO|nr:MFS transporter [Phycicoccus endophyticus]NHI20000.1 MFS transporter [Phycicoccus endophyticus]QNN48808.1 MFS transporter [Phycicoccus endophyticus]GGL42735.1 MFS transporter [Phycicoccus endophyticus]
MATVDIAHQPARRPGARAWLTVLLLLLFMVINFGDKAVLGLSAKPLMSDLGLSASQYGEISSAFFFLFSASALVVGFIIDRFPTRWVLLVMAVVWSATMLPVALGVGYAGLLVSRIVLGGAEGPAFPVANHAAHKWFPQHERSIASSLVSLGVPLGVIIAAPVETRVIETYGWRTAFVTLAVAGLVWAAVWLVLGREGTVDEAEQVRPGADAEAAPADLAHGAGAAQDPPYWRILLTGTWIGSVLSGFAAYYAVALLVAWVPPYLETSGYSATEMSGLVTLPWMVNGLALLAYGPLARTLGSRGVSGRVVRGVLGGGAVAVGGLAMFLFLHVGHGPVKIAMMSLGFGLGAVVFAVAQATCAELAPPSRRGGVLGLYGALYATAGVIAPYVTGRLVDASATPLDGYVRSFAVAGALLVVGGLAAVVLVDPGRDARRVLGATRPAATVPAESASQ